MDSGKKPNLSSKLFKNHQKHVNHQSSNHNVIGASERFAPSLSPEEVGEMEDNLRDLGLDDTELDRLIEHAKQNPTDERNETINVQNLTIVLLGKNGQGKSSTGNSLLGVDNEFQTGFGQKTVTNETASVTILTDVMDMEKLRLTIIDTPGLFDQPEESDQLKTAREKYEKAQTAGSQDAKQLKQQLENIEKKEREDRERFLRSEVIKCIQYGCDGISAFFLVMNCNGRFDQSSSDTLKAIKEYFGAQHMDYYMFIALTKADELARKRMTEEEYIDKFMHEAVKDFLGKLPGTNRRLVFIDNCLVSNENKAEALMKMRRDIFQAVQQNMNDCNIPPYSSRHFIGPGLAKVRLLLIESFKKFEESWKNVINDLTAAKEEYDKKIKKLPTQVALTVAGTVVTLSGSGFAAGVKFWKGRTGKKEMNAAIHIVEVFLQSGQDYTHQLQEAERELLRKRIALWPALQANEEAKFQRPILSSTVGCSSSKIKKYLKNLFLETGGAGVGIAAAVTGVGLAAMAICELIFLANSVYKQKEKMKQSEHRFAKLQEISKDTMDKVRKVHDNVIKEIDEFMGAPERACCCMFCGKLWSDPELCYNGSHVLGCKKCVDENRKVQKGNSDHCPGCEKWTNSFA